MHNIKSHSIKVGSETLSWQTGKLAQQAQGSVLCRYGDQVLLTTAGVGNARDGIDFFPLVVDFEGKYYSTGKIKGSRFNKREGRATNSHILFARMIDRPLRPMFAKGITNEVQIICTHLQGDNEHNASAMAITSASLAVLLAGLPFEAPVSAVRVGMDESGTFVLNPSFELSKKGDLDLLVAGTEDSITMVEAGANLLSHAKMLEALEFAHKEIIKICQAQKEFLAQHEIETAEVQYKTVIEGVDALVSSALSEEDFDAIEGATKKEVKKKMHAKEDVLLTHYTEQIEAGEISEKALKAEFQKQFSKSLRRRAFGQGVRVDGRKVDEVRELYTEVGVLERLHGTGLFQRGETQVLSVTTLSGPRDAKIVDDPDRPEEEKYYVHHYNFPPFSVGEVRMLRGAGRREIGHGALAERALEYVLPTKEEGFPYMIRVVSEILACNGSSSMGSVCGSTLSLMDAGVPIKAVIGGIAMGLFMDETTGEYKILSDIQGLEDFDGDMDFKVAGSVDGITALQLDIKVKGLKIELLAEALKQAEAGLGKIIQSMTDSIAEPRTEMNPHAPRIETIKVEEDFIAAIIGKGGENIQRMTKQYNASIDIQDDGTIFVATVNQDDALGVQKEIAAITYKPKVGDIFEQAEIRSILDFGAFAQIAPGRDGLIHVSEIAEERVEKVEDYLKKGQTVKVKIVGIDDKGRIKLSMKQA